MVGANAYGFDASNRLTSSTTSSGAMNLSYDPAGRLYETAVSGGTTSRFLYDGADVIAEYDGANNLARRYVHGPSVDEPLVWLEGTGTSGRRWLLADERGSIVAQTNASGAVTLKNLYDIYGTPQFGNQGLFQYTGQMWLAEAGLYNYKARAYHPGLGRFIQPDPIGYAGGMNLYAYVGNDPENFTDSTGTIGLPGAAAGAAIGFFVGGLVAGGAEVARQRRVYGRVVDRRQVRTAAIGGGVAGAFTGTVIGSGAGALSAAVTGAFVNGPTAYTVSVVNQKYTAEWDLINNTVSQRDALQAGVAGVVGGAVPIPGSGVAVSIVGGHIVGNIFNGMVEGRKRRNDIRDGYRREKYPGSSVFIEDQLTFDPDLLVRGYYDNLIDQWIINSVNRILEINPGRTGFPSATVTIIDIPTGG